MAFSAPPSAFRLLGADWTQELKKVTSEFDVSGLLDIALEIAKKDEKLMEQLTAALVAGNDAEALRLARLLCGVSDEKSRFVH
jgi:hypothetical protein